MKLIMKVDYSDMVHRAHAAGQGLYDEERIDALFRRCKEAGFTHVLWRTSFLGKVCYPSRVMTPVDGDYSLDKSLLECMARFDPLSVAVEIARRYKISIAPWITTVDSYWPGNGDPFFARNPHLLLMDRKNERVERGVPCYAYPEVREYRLAEAREVVDEYGVDGIYYSSHSHNDCTRCQGDLEGRDAYGFNPPLAEAYKARYGTDPRKDDFDNEKMQLIRGGFYLQFLEEARKICARKGGSLFLDCAMLNAEVVKAWQARSIGTGLYAGPRYEYYIPWKDVLGVSGDVFLGVIGTGGGEAVDDLARIWTDCPSDHAYWFNIHVGGNRGAAEKEMASWRQVLKRAAEFPLLSGFTFHEAMTFEFDCPELWDFALECANLGFGKEG